MASIVAFACYRQWNRLNGHALNFVLNPIYSLTPNQDLNWQNIEEHDKLVSFVKIDALQSTPKTYARNN